MQQNVDTTTPPKKRRRPHGCLLALLAIVCCLGLIKLELRRSAMETAREWSGMNPLPVNLFWPRIEVLGSMFTREFVIEFRSTREKIQKWVQNSTSANAKVASIHSAGGWDIYSLEPRGGAAFAELWISPDGKHVMLRTFWS